MLNSPSSSLKNFRKQIRESHSNIILSAGQIIETKLLTVATAGSRPAFSNVHYFWRYDLQRASVLSLYPEDLFDWDKLVSTPFNRDPETGEIFTSDFCFYSDQVYVNQELLDAQGIKVEDIPGN